MAEPVRKRSLREAAGRKPLAERVAATAGNGAAVPAIKLAEVKKAAPPAAKKVPPRLPDGSKYAAAYSAAEMKWTGTLTVPDHGVFHARAGALFTLMSKLDRFYRIAAREKSREKTDEQLHGDGAGGDPQGEVAAAGAVQS